jgi:hypothetical protein
MKITEAKMLPLHDFCAANNVQAHARELGSGGWVAFFEPAVQSHLGLDPAEIRGRGESAESALIHLCQSLSGHKVYIPSTAVRRRWWEADIPPAMINLRYVKVTP